MWNEIQSDIEAIADFARVLKQIWHVITHPSIIWNWFLGISFWIACIGSVVCILYYAVTESKKPIQIMWVIIITYILIKGVS